MADFTKDREELLKISVDFTSALADGDSVSALSGVEVTESTDGGGTWTDVSAEFGSPSGTLNSNAVDVTLGAASGTDQDPTDSARPSEHQYRIRTTVTTANGETLIATPSLEITAVGDTDAP